jgi:hypothetical protein
MQLFLKTPVISCRKIQIMIKQIQVENSRKWEEPYPYQYRLLQWLGHDKIPAADSYHLQLEN